VDSVPQVAIIAALEREIRPLVRSWKKTVRDYEGRTFTFYHNPRAVLVCGGIGAEAARRATEAAITLYQPSLLISAGFAGALSSEMNAGQAFSPRTIIDARDGSRTDTRIGVGVLVTVTTTAHGEARARLAESYGAQAVDMEAASVAKGADAHGLPCIAVKAISDEVNFPMIPMKRFITADGQFQEGRLVLYAVVRPWLWSNLITLARNSRRASQALCRWLDQFNYEENDTYQPGLHPARRVRF
jgi:adenosylhomocysteine nucleosidase